VKSVIALGLEYDGAPWCGWQTQAAGIPTVQASLETALKEIADGRATPVTAAGRTDTGVHAALQIVHFEPKVVRPLSAWVRGVNVHLHQSIAVRWAVEVDANFHARFSAISRRYTYWLLDRDARPGLHAGRVGWTHLAMNGEAMHEAAQHLVGTHDFSAFRAAACQAKSPIKTMHALSVKRVGDFIRVDAHANAFLHHMIRNIMGALVYVGAGKIPAAQIGHILKQIDRKNAPPTFAPDGLYLCGIEYPPEFALPESYVETTP
jgi:tRNA pseudouridine38-40 synthase